jgi:hypothetical protein
MSLVHTLDTPVLVGDLSSNVTVSALKLVSISINFEDVYVNNGTAILSICLIDPVSGYPVNIVYQNETALSIAQAIQAQAGAQIFSLLVADGKLPAGSVADTSDTSVDTAPLKLVATR